MKVAIAAFAAAAMVAAGCSSSSGSSSDIVVLAASSLVDVFEGGDLGTVSLNSDDTTAEVRFSYSGSNALVAQLRDGAHADVLITASRSTMDVATANGSVAGRPVLLARNQLVLATPLTNPAGISSLDDLADSSKVIGLCAPQVPCGALAETALEALGVVAEPDTLEPNVRALANKISIGEIDAGLIYRTDAMALNLSTVPVVGLGRFTTDYLAATISSRPEPTVAALFAELTAEGPLTNRLTDRGFDVP